MSGNGADKNGCVVWRYMDLLELFALLESGSLHFTRVDMLVDPLEGTYAQITRRMTQALKPRQNELLGRFADTEQRLRRCVGVNSWYENARESALMWKLYAGDHGIAIRTTLERLADSFSDDAEHVRVDRVNYFDTDDLRVDERDDVLWPFLHKWHHYSDEREVRALFLNSGTESELPDEGVVLDVDIDTLIDAVVLSPFVPEWAHEPIHAVLQRTSIGERIEHSTLPSKP